MMKITDEKTERFERASRLACDIIEECRVQLMLKFRFLDLALWRMELVPVHSRSRYPLSTDGSSIYFEPYSVLARFDESFEEMLRDYLHLIMHCIFRHPYDEGHTYRLAWSLACDVIAESVAMEMCATRFASEEDADRAHWVERLRTASSNLVPGQLYQLFMQVMRNPEGVDYAGFSMSDIIEMQALFERDNHESWPAYNDREPEERPGEVEEVGEQDENAEEEAQPSEHDLQSTSDMDLGQTNPDDKVEEVEASESDDAPEEAGDDDADETSKNEDSSSLDTADEELEGSLSEQDTERELEDERSSEEREWEEIAKQIEMNLETFSREWGDEARGLISSLAIANRRTYDYSDFLRRFATMSEDMRINDDEFDYVFYTYGLELYGNMPLIEPLEYKDENRIRDFVIAIDTSESVSGDLCKRFIESTFDILMQSQEFGSTVNVHIIQCDAQVQADTKITSTGELKAYLEKFYVRGFGGTDFRPVFDYISDLQDRGELQDLQGLLYFTDGLGTYPEKMPPYDTAFVFLDTGEQHLPPVPPWAMKVVIDEEGIDRFKSKLV